MKPSHFGIGKEKDYFIDNLTMLLASGMDVSYALAAIKAEIRSKSLQRIISEMEQDINAGSPLWRAMAASELLPDHVVALVRIGEETGRLPQNLKVIAIQQEKDRLFRSKIRSAMIYPILVLLLTLVIGTGISWFILPRLASVFSELKIELPLVTRILIGGGRFLGEYGAYVIPGALALVGLVFYFVFFFPKTKVVGEKILFAIPLVKRLIREAELARMGFILGTLLEAGMPVLGALDSLVKATTFRVFQKLYRYLHNSVEEGNSMQKSFTLFPKIKKLIPITVQQMIAAGERSGMLPQTLLKIGEVFEAKTDTTTKNLTVLLEPILLVIVWLGVVGVAMAVILPIYSLIGGLNEQTPAPQTPPPAVAPPPVVPTTTVEVILLPTLEILPTPVGYLNIRESPSTSAGIIGRAEVGEVYEYQNVAEDWYEIVLSPEETGWVSAEYVRVID